MENQKMSNQKKKSGIQIMFAQLGCIVLAMILLMLINGRDIGDFLYMYMDITSLFLLLLLALPAFLLSGLWKDLVRIFHLGKEGEQWKLSELKSMLEAVGVLQRQFVYGTCMIVVFQVTDVLHNMMDLASVGSALGMIMNVVLYTAFLNLLLMPLKIEVKKRLNDYMEEDAA